VRHLASVGSRVYFDQSAAYSHLTAMRCGIELSADEILGEPDDQVVIHGHLHALAELTRSRAAARVPLVSRVSGMVFNGWWL